MSQNKPRNPNELNKEYQRTVVSLKRLQELDREMGEEEARLQKTFQEMFNQLCEQHGMDSEAVQRIDRFAEACAEEIAKTADKIIEPMIRKVVESPLSRPRRTFV